jgi:hypothetical protein
VCRLRGGRLEEGKSDFEALSYVWGETKDTIDIHCEGQTVGITSNLDAALRHIRKTNRSRFLWVDAICINQNDVSERGHQVKLMRSIYKKARQVLIWIGEDEQYALSYHDSRTTLDWNHRSKSGTHITTRATHAFEIFHHIYDHMTVRFAPLKKTHKKAKWVPVDEETWEEDLELLRAGRNRRPVWDDSWEVVEDFFSSPWFCRQWVIQEVVVASSATVIWGDREIQWAKIGEVANWLKIHHPPSRRQYIMGAYNASYIYYLAMEAKRGRLHPFLTVVASAWNFQSTDPRDRIYAMVGMPNLDSNPDSGELFVNPDYSLTTSQVYTAFARRVLVKERSLRIFSAVQHEPETPIPLPSWVPQWQPPLVEPLVPIGHVVNHMPTYSIPNQSIFTFDSELLILRGLTVGTIAGHTDSIESPTPTKMRSINQDCLIDCVEGVLNSLCLKLTMARLKSLCWTLTVGRGNDFWANHVNHWDMFQELWLEARKQFHLKSWNLIGQIDTDEVERSLGIHGFLGSATYGRRVFVTSDGTIGLGPVALQPGDIVTILFGGFTPFVLRRVDDYYVLIGECYVHGQMDGCAVEEWEDTPEEASVFHLR